MIGIEVFNADIEARKLFHFQEVISEINAIFGPQVINADGLVNKEKISAIVFNDPEMLDALNHIIHPRVRNMFSDKLQNVHQDKYAIYESALIFETGFYKNLNASILVVADERIRIERVMKRDGIQSEKVLERMRNQLAEIEKKKMADYIIDNNGSVMLLPQILRIHQELISLKVQE